MLAEAGVDPPCRLLSVDTPLELGEAEVDPPRREDTPLELGEAGVDPPCSADAALELAADDTSVLWRSSSLLLGAGDEVPPSRALSRVDESSFVLIVLASLFFSALHAHERRANDAASEETHTDSTTRCIEQMNMRTDKALVTLKLAVAKQKQVLLNGKK